MKYLHILAFIFVIVGALNWGLVAFDLNVVEMLLGSWPMVEKAVYILVGLSAIYLVVKHPKECAACMGMGK